MQFAFSLTSAMLCVPQAFQQEIYLNTGKIELVFRQGDSLIEKSEPLDAAVIEEELEELQRYCQEVFGRIERYYKKLTRLPVSKDTLTTQMQIACRNTKHINILSVEIDAETRVS